MRSRIGLWSRLAPIVGVITVSGCLGRIENGVDLVLGIGAPENLLRAPISGALGGLALFFGRLTNIV